MKKALCIGLACLMLIGAAACGNSAVTKEQVIGSWKSEEYVVGSDWISLFLTVSEDNTVTKTQYVNGAVSMVETNTWTIEDGTLHIGAEVYQMQGDKLVCDNRTYTKQ